MKEFKRIAEWDLLPRFYEGLKKFSKSILETKTTTGQVKILKEHISEMRSEEARKCKL